jgi:hypothetical protein
LLPPLAAISHLGNSEDVDEVVKMPSFAAYHTTWAKCGHFGRHFYLTIKAATLSEPLLPHNPFLHTNGRSTLTTSL